MTHQTPEDKWAEGYALSGTQEGQDLMNEAIYAAWTEGRSLDLGKAQHPEHRPDRKKRKSNK